MTTKPKITSFGKPFSYLKDPDLRRKETSDSLLRIEGALFSGEHFEDVEWRNINFVSCDFVGGYEISLSACINVTFTDCNFSGVLSWGDTLDVRFLRCGWIGQSVMYGERHSKNTVFESCDFRGTSSDKNHWGAVGTHGEALFINCNAKWFNLDGDAKLGLQGCVLEDVICEPSRKYGGSHVTIENCKLRGLFRMAGGGTLVQSLTIRDTVLENLDLFNATVKEDVVIERVRGGTLKISVKEGARNFVLKDSQIYGNANANANANAICSVYAGAFNTLLVENNIFGGGPGKRTGIGGGFEPGDKSPQPVLTQSLVFRNNKIPSLRSGRLNAAQVLLEGNTIDSLELQQGRIGSLKIVGITISRSVDFTNTQVKESNVQSFAKGQAKLEGSNIKLN